MENETITKIETTEKRKVFNTLQLKSDCNVNYGQIRTAVNAAGYSGMSQNKKAYRAVYKLQMLKEGLFEVGKPLEMLEKAASKSISAEKNKILDNVKKGTFSPKGIFYFDSSVLFSRSKFRELFPEAKITYSPEKADHYICDITKVKENLKLGIMRATRSYALIPVETGITPEGDKIIEQFISEQYSHLFQHDSLYMTTALNDELRAIFETIDEIANSKNVILPNEIPLSSGSNLDESTFYTIEKLFTSGIAANVQLALSMLSGFNYENSKARIAILYFKYFHNVNASDLKMFVDLRTILSRLKMDFKFLEANSEWSKSHRYHNYNDSRVSTPISSFWFFLFKDFQEDTLVKYEFYKWVYAALLVPTFVGDVTITVDGNSINKQEALKNIQKNGGDNYEELLTTFKETFEKKDEEFKSSEIKDAFKEVTILEGIERKDLEEALKQKD